MDRRQALTFISGVALGAGAVPASAQALASLRTIRIVVPFAPGGATDVQARAIGRELATVLNVTVIVDNKSGAGGLIGAGEVAKSRPDGSTLLYSPDMVVTQTPHTLKKMAFDPFKGLAPVARTAEAPLVLLANLDVPFQTVDALIAYAKANPGKVSYASHGTGTGSHIYGEVLASKYGLQMIHVPYKAMGESMMDLFANRTQIQFQAPAAINQFPGKMRVLAATGVGRSSLLPDVPTLHELGYPGFELGGWNGFYAAGGTPAVLVAELNAAINQASRRPAVADVWRAQGFALVNEPSTGIAEMIKREHAQWGAYFKIAGIEPQ